MAEESSGQDAAEAGTGITGVLFEIFAWVVLFATIWHTRINRTDSGAVVGEPTSPSVGDKPPAINDDDHDNPPGDETLERESPRFETRDWAAPDAVASKPTPLPVGDDEPSDATAAPEDLERDSERTRPRFASSAQAAASGAAAGEPTPLPVDHDEPPDAAAPEDDEARDDDEAEDVTDAKTPQRRAHGRRRRRKTKGGEPPTAAPPPPAPPPAPPPPDAWGVGRPFDVYS